MANKDRDTVYTNDDVNRTVYTRENNSIAWFFGIIVALALLAIAYLVFSANTQPSTTPNGSTEFKSLEGATVVASTDTSLTLMKADGLCVSLDSVRQREMSFDKADCPATPQ